MDEENREVISRPSFNESLDKMIGDAWCEVKDDFSHGTGMAKAASAAKLVGKGSLYLGVKLIQNLPEAVQKMKEKQGK